MRFQGGRMREASGQCKPQSPFPIPLLPNSVSYALLFLTYTVPSFKQKSEGQERREEQNTNTCSITPYFKAHWNHHHSSGVLCSFTGHKGFCEKHLPSINQTDITNTTHILYDVSGPLGNFSNYVEKAFFYVLVLWFTLN